MSESKKLGALHELVRTACLPAAQEIGEILQDQLSYWKTINKVKVLGKTANYLKQYNQDTLPAGNPRVISEAIESSGNISDEHLQELWAGLIASSFSGSPTDDQNIIYINVLNKLTRLQGIILDYITPKFKIYVTEHGLIATGQCKFHLDDFMLACACSDRMELDVSLDHLREIGLISGGIDIRLPEINIQLSPLCLNLYSRCKGYSGDLFEYYGVNKSTDTLPATDLEIAIREIKSTTQQLKESTEQV